MITVPIARIGRHRLPARASRHVRPRLAAGIVKRSLAEPDCAEAQWASDFLCDQILIWPAGHSFEHHPKNDVAAVRVAKAGSRRKIERLLEGGRNGTLTPL